MTSNREKEGKKCTSCEQEVDTKYTEFKCPECSEETIVRCSSCRILGVSYTCPKCGFTGP